MKACILIVFFQFQMAILDFKIENVIQTINESEESDMSGELLDTSGDSSNDDEYIVCFLSAECLHYIH